MCGLVGPFVQRPSPASPDCLNPTTARLDFDIEVDAVAACAERRPRRRVCVRKEAADVLRIRSKGVRCPDPASSSV
jgi:hypothetical protein